ncbi:MAG: sigma-70 family RNA polymerase sigma factor [Candidatus Sulfotelmatobacter sp.]
MPDAGVSSPADQVAGHERVAREMEEVLSRRLPYFYGIAYRFLGNAADAEDAVQEGLLTAYKNLHQFRGEAQLSTWLATIVSNSARMQLRRRPRYTYVSLNEPIGTKYEAPLSERLASAGPSPEDDCRHSEMNGRLAKAASRLTPVLRTTLQLRVVEGFSILETAKILGLACGTVKAQLSRARSRMKQSLSRRSSRRYGTAVTLTSQGE